MIISKLLIFLIYLGIHISSLHSNNFPGGYISFGISIGRVIDKSLYYDAQISSGIVLAGPYHNNELPGYLFIGLSSGRRTQIDKLSDFRLPEFGFKYFSDLLTNKNKDGKYYDVQTNIWSAVTIGYGKGYIFIDNKWRSRQKTWFAYGFFPVVATYDNYKLSNKASNQIGLMCIIPYPLLGKYFYP